MRYLAIDYGLQRIGLAYSEGESAQALETITAKTQQARVNVVLEMLKKYPADVIVVGATASTITPQRKKFMSMLKDHFVGPIVTTEEALTTHQAESALIAAGTSKKNRRKNLDAVAAAYILDSYLTHYET